jgi:hypothetical protein
MDSRVSQLSFLFRAADQINQDFSQIKNRLQHPL